MKKLIITEKPSVARDIAKVLNIRMRKDGYMEGEDYVITWAVGHLVTLYEPQDYDASLKRWSYQSLPIIPESIKIKPYPQTKKQLSIIQKLCDRKDVDSLICATDSGREGELIFRYIYDYVQSTKPFSRLWISSMTDEAIKEGFEHLKDGKEYNRCIYRQNVDQNLIGLLGLMQHALTQRLIIRCLALDEYRHRRWRLLLIDIMKLRTLNREIIMKWL